MSAYAIEAVALSKRFHIGGPQPRREGLLARQVLDAVLAPARRAAGLLRGHATGAADLNESFWALRDLSFQIAAGEICGIIGRNGAGKSTLLKILSRITEPTRGRAVIHGRVGSLLEVGTGFHPELTGRENVYLNGAILGMGRRYIERMFDEIVDFAEVERFIDTPVKHYSSGMRLRLAFAVAAHLEPEILMIDEVLAVGDARFQRKCINKMQNVGGEGRTVLFVSHSMPAITRLCQRVLLLDEGALVCDGSPGEVVTRYLSDGQGSVACREWHDPAKAPGGEIARLRAVRVRTAEGEVRSDFDIRRPVGIEMVFEVLRPGYVLMPHHYLFSGEGVELFTTIDRDPQWRRRPRPVGEYTSTAWIPGNLLSEGMVYVNTVLWAMEPARIMQFHEKDVVGFQVLDSLDGDSARADFTGDLKGAVRPMLDWTTRYRPGLGRRTQSVQTA